MTGISPNARAVLDAISFAEGTAGANGYTTMFGGGQFDWRKGHPDQVVDGGRYKSAAAGRYQFMPSTWSGVSKQLGLKDFSPQSQDLAALQLIRNRGVDPDQPMTAESWAKLAPEWASLPTLGGKSYYGQPVKSLDSIMGVYQRSLGGQPMGPTTSSGDRADLFEIDSGFTGDTPATSKAANPLAAVADALVRQSLGEAAQKTWEPGRMALGMPAQRQVTEALKAQTDVINALFGGEKPQAVAAASGEMVSPVAPAADFTGGGGFIARTGNSGISTGPHLDARWADGRPITPQALDQYLSIGGKAPSAWTLTSGYGPRQAPAAGASSFHKGVDLGIPAGTPIYATGKARLKQSMGEQGGAGYMVTVETPEGDLNLLHLTPGSSPLSRA